jgi:hypothetical protein
MTNSNAKGKRGERAWRDELRDAGFLKARRGQQFAGGHDSPDVICPELPGLHFEVKYTQRLDVYGAVIQATSDAKAHQLPVVAHRRNNASWLVTMRSDVFFKMVKDAGYPEPAHCIHCESLKFKKNGKDEKTFQRYLCLSCHKSF